MDRVQRMQLGVEMVRLGKEVILDMSTSTRSPSTTGRGSAGWSSATVTLPPGGREDLRDWARRIDWDVTPENDNIIVERSELSRSSPSP